MTNVYILLMRHAEAQEYKNAQGERPLTEKGQQQAKKKAQKILDFSNLSMIYTSSILRAQQTANIIAKTCSRNHHAIQTVATEQLSPGIITRENNFEKLIKSVITSSLLVFHNPDIEIIATRLNPQQQPTLCFAPASIAIFSQDLKKSQWILQEFWR